MSQQQLMRWQPVRPPSRLERMVEAVRSYTLGPWSTKDKALVGRLGGRGPTSSGVPVNEDLALACAAVWNAVSLVSDDVSSLPLLLYKRLPSGGKDRFEDHRLYRIAHDAPNPEMSSMVCRRTIHAHAMTYGTGYGEIERDTVGRPVAIWPLLPDRMEEVREFGRLIYRYTNPTGRRVDFDPADVLRIAGLSFDGGTGYNVIDKARESIALSLAAERFGATFFGNGATIGGVVSFKGPKPPAQSEDNKSAELAARHEGVDRAHRLLLLYNDAKFDQTAVAPDKAQFLETRVHQIREIARRWKIPPHKLGDLADATYSNVEQMELAYYTSCLRPWLVIWEQELNKKLIAPSEQRIQFFEHNVEGLLRADSAGRAEFYGKLQAIGAITINEIRNRENLDPIEGGDRSFVQGAMVPLDRMDDIIDAQIKAKAPQPAPAPAPPTDEQINSITTVLEARLAEQTAAFSAQTELVKAEVEQRVAAETDAARSKETVETLTADLARNREVIAANEAALVAVECEKATAIAEAKGDAEKQIAAIEAKRLAIVADLAAARTEKNDLDVMLGIAEKERDDAKRSLEAALGSETALKVVLAESEQEVRRVTADLQAAAAVSEELRRTVKDLTLAHADAEAKRVAAETVAATLGEQLKRADTDARDSTRAVVTMTRQLEGITAAHRALIVDAVDRLVQRESDRARKAQATPEKLRAWIDTFYPLHGDLCRSIYRPVVLAWAASAGANPDTALSELVQAHVDESRRELRLVADVEDPDELSALLARLLRRWETERPNAVADRLMAEGEQYGQ